MFCTCFNFTLQQPQEYLNVMKRGTDIPLLLIEVVRITQMCKML